MAFFTVDSGQWREASLTGPVPVRLGIEDGSVVFGTVWVAPKQGDDDDETVMHWWKDQEGVE